MRYDVFKEENLKASQGYPSQMNMENIFHDACVPHDEGEASLNDFLAPEFVSCSWEEQSIKLRFSVRPIMLNPMGNLHGGMIASVCDLSMGILARYVKGSASCVTVHLSIEYLRGIQKDSDILVEARAEKKGRTVQFLTARVYREKDHELAACATAEFI